MSPTMRGISLILAIALVLQTTGCYTTRMITRTEGEKIEEDLQNSSIAEELLSGIRVRVTLRPEISDTLKKKLARIAHSEGGKRDIKCYIKTINQNSILVDIPGYAHLGGIEIQLSDIQRIAISERAFSGANTTFLVVAVAVILVIGLVDLINDLEEGFEGFGTGG